MRKWITAREGIRYREHPTRKEGIKKDRYFTIYYRLNGKRKEEAIGWTSKGWTIKKANTLLATLQEHHRIGYGPQTLKEMREISENNRQMKKMKAEQERKNNILFSSFFEDVYFPNAKTNKKFSSWIKESEHFRNWLKPELGHLSLKNINTFNLEKIKRKMLNKGKSPRTIQYCFATFRQVWNYAIINNIVSIDCPMKKIKLPKVDNKRERFLNHEEAKRLLNALKDKSQQAHNMVLLSLHTGMRTKEILDLTWGVIDRKNGSAVIRDSKGKTRHVYLTQTIQAMLNRMYKNQANKEFLFKDNNDKQLNKISKTFFRTVFELGFNEGITDRRNKVFFHTLRHTFASWHVQSGTDLYTIKELLGHSTIQLTERYSHLRPDGLKQTAKDFDKIVSRNPGIIESIYAAIFNENI